MTDTNHMDCMILLGCFFSFFVWKRAYWTFYKITPFVFHEWKQVIHVCNFMKVRKIWLFSSGSTIPVKREGKGNVSCIPVADKHSRVCSWNPGPHDPFCGTQGPSDVTRHWKQTGSSQVIASLTWGQLSDSTEDSLITERVLTLKPVSEVNACKITKENNSQRWLKQ